MKIGTNDDQALARLRDILDAYGGDADRWPEVDREAALALIARNAEARELCDEALRLDTALDLLPAAEPSSDLEERILAAARHTSQGAPPPPGIASLDEARLRRDAGGGRRRRLLLAAALPLAAAAALALWVAREERTPQQVASAHGTQSQQVGASSGGADTSEAELLAALGSYHTPGDALLELSGLDDVYDADPWHGCSEGDLGCVKKDTLPLEPVSQGAANEVRMLS